MLLKVNLTYSPWGKTARLLRWVMIPALGLPLLLADPPAPVGVNAPVLLIKVAYGEGGVNSTTTPNVVAPQVLITDADHVPVPSVSVTFAVDKPGLGMFGGNQTSFSTRTDAYGVAVARGYVPLRPGSLTVSVLAEKDGVTAVHQIHQRNWNKSYSALGGGGHRKWPVVAAAVGAAGAITAYALSGGEAPIATITLGQVGIGGPR